MQTPTESGDPRRHHDILVGILLAALALPACDTFFGMRGQVTDCATDAPLVGVGIDVQVDRGYQDRMVSLPDYAMTDAAGNYAVHLNEPERSWVTLTFHFVDYESFTSPQFKGHAYDDAPYDMCLTPSLPLLERLTAAGFSDGVPALVR